MKKTSKPLSNAIPVKQLESFIGKFDSKIAKTLKEARQVLRKRFPTANELVYDNYNFFVIGFCTTERPSNCMFSLAANAKGVGLSFYYGSTLPDPHKILEGSGTQNRFIRLESAATLSNPEVKELLLAAVAQAKAPLPPTGRGKLIIRSVSAKQRPRRIVAREAAK
jgi:hypothetical protein